MASARQHPDKPGRPFAGAHGNDADRPAIIKSAGARRGLRAAKSGCFVSILVPLGGFCQRLPFCHSDGDYELHYKNPPTPCFLQAPASTQNTKRKTRPAIRRSARWRAIARHSKAGRNIAAYGFAVGLHSRYTFGGFYYRGNYFDALAIELSSTVFANSRIRAPPHVHPRSPGSRPSFCQGLNEEFFYSSKQKSYGAWKIKKIALCSLNLVRTAL